MIRREPGAGLTGRHWSAVDAVRALAPMPIRVREFEKLLEYSCSLPTGTTPGKIWRCHKGVFDHHCTQPAWMIGKYGDVSADGKTIAIHWFKPVFRVPAGLTPSTEARMPDSDPSAQAREAERARLASELETVKREQREFVCRECYRRQDVPRDSDEVPF